MDRPFYLRSNVMTYFKNNMALKFGVKSAIVAQFLWDSLYIQKTDCAISKQQGKAISLMMRFTR